MALTLSNGEKLSLCVCLWLVGYMKLIQNFIFQFIYKCMYVGSRGIHLLSGPKGLRNLDLKAWKITENLEKAAIVFASVPH